MWMKGLKDFIKEIISKPLIYYGFLTSAKSIPCGSICSAMPCLTSSMNSSSLRNFTAQRDLQSFQ